MFHRPKPETKNETPSTEIKLPLEASSSASPVAVVADNTPTTETETKTETMSTQTKKDTETMTKDQDNKAAEADAKKSVDIPQTTTSSSPFQRPANTAASGQGKSYGGSYNPTPYGAGATPSAGASGNGRRLVIGEGITMSGEIESCDHLLVEGSVEAALKGAKVLEISETGKFYGTVEIEEATIAGHFEGEVNVSGRLTVASTGVITGSIAYGELQIEAGATLDGRLAPLSAAATAKKGKGKAAAKKSDAELPLAS